MNSFKTIVFLLRILTGGVKVESDPCLPPAAVDIIFDDRKISAIDAERGSQNLSLSGELIRIASSCGTAAIALGERNVHFYSAETGSWQSLTLLDSAQGTSPAKGVNLAIARRMILFSTSAQGYFFNAASGHVATVALHGERLRGAVAFDDSACLITDRRVYCLVTNQKNAAIFALNDMHIQSAKASTGKTIMTAPEKTLIYYSSAHRFEFLPLR